MTDALLQSAVPGLDVRRGKVRDIYDTDDRLVIVATDRISAFDCIMPTPIPGKGRVLTQMSLFWFDFLKDVTGNHLVTAERADMPAPFCDHAELDERTMLVKKAEVFPVECVIRGYLSGSGWKDYRATGKVCGHELPEGLKESARLPEPIFTPATKATTGHDENISFERCAEIVGQETAEELRRRSLEIYNRAADYALQRGIVIADTKFEWGLADGEIVLVDEVLTPDSSRFWPKDQYAEGRSQPSFDKQFVRDYLETLDWDKTPPAPPLPDDIVEKTLAKYKQALEILTK